MKSTNRLFLLLMVALQLAGCIPAGLTAIPTQIEMPVSSPTLITPTPISALTLTATVMSTLSPTLESEQAKETIKDLLQGSADCEAPCFLEIVPGRTTLEEAINIFAHLGLSLKHTNTRGNKDFYSVVYNLGNGLEVTPILTIQNNNIVESLDVGINDTTEVGTQRKWTAYSPDTLIKRYGSTSQVDFFLGRVAPVPTHSMVLYFEEVKLIVEYISSSLLNKESELEICPLTNYVEHIHIWIGNDPQYPPSPGVPLEKATSLTMEEFSMLMMGEAENACFNLKKENFPQ